jgi:hypothetical protein
VWRKKARVFPVMPHKYNAQSGQSERRGAVLEKAVAKGIAEDSPPSGRHPSKTTIRKKRRHSLWFSGTGFCGP